MTFTRKLIIILLVTITAVFPLIAQASWLSDLVGVDCNLGRGDCRVGRPDPQGAIQRFPEVVEGTIRDAATGFSSVALAEAIRWSRNRAMRTAQPLPPHVAEDLARFFPPDLIRRARYSTDWGALQNGTLQQFLLGNGHAHAVALGDVIVFANPRDLNDRWLWAHEMRHLQQYGALGIEEFARRYVWNSNGLESDASRFANQVLNQPLPVRRVTTRTRGRWPAWGRWR